MQEHISTLLTRYKGQVYCWDVVNEALSDDGGWRTDSPWFAAAGADEDCDGIPDYIEKAFEFARQADPSALLFYNDYNIESGAKLEAAVRLVKALKEKGLVDGVGIQGHWSIFEPDAQTVRNAIERFESLGVDVQITELDLSVFRWGDTSSLAALPPDLESRQAAQYDALFKVFRDESGAPGSSRAGQPGKLTGVTFWALRMTTPGWFFPDFREGKLAAALRYVPETQAGILGSGKVVINGGGFPPPFSDFQMLPQESRGAPTDGR